MVQSIRSQLSQSALWALDKAHEEGFIALIKEIRQGGCGPPSRSPSDALVHLSNSLASGSYTEYADPNVAAAYMVRYHLSHCVMAFWCFGKLFDQVGVPQQLYVCDIGAGTGAGIVGLELALSARGAHTELYFDHCEPSLAMRRAGFWFHEKLSKLSRRVTAAYDATRFRWRADVPKDLPVGISGSALRVISGFHISLPYAGVYGDGLDEVSRCIQDAMNLVNPHACVFTCHKGKRRSLDTVVGNPFREPGNTVLKLPYSEKGDSVRPKFYAELVGSYGFYLPTSDLKTGSNSPVHSWNLHRFSTPKDALVFLQVSPPENRSDVLRFSKSDAQPSKSEPQPSDPNDIDDLPF